MTKYKIKWKKIYLAIVGELLDRAGGNSLGHHTFPVRKIFKNLIHKYNKDILEEDLERLIRKEDLVIWPAEAIKIKEDYSISINLAHFNDLRYYLRNKPAMLRRVEELGKGIGIS